MGDRGATIILLLILCFVLVSLPQIRIVKAQDTVYIREDGTVEGTDNIQRNGDIYTLTGNISSGIQVERSNIVLDGAGYTIQGDGEGCGVDLSNGRRQDPSRTRIENVTIKNLQIINFGIEIELMNSASHTIVGNYIAEFGHEGIGMGGGDFIIKHNTFINNPDPASSAASITLGYVISGTKTITENNFYTVNGFYAEPIRWFLSTEPVFSRNYWSRYNGTDINGDGVGDTPYTVFESDLVKLIDFHPLMAPVDIPLFQEPVIPEFPSESRIYIRADGSVEGTDKIQRIGNTLYTVSNTKVKLNSLTDLTQIAEIKLN